MLYFARSYFLPAVSVIRPLLFSTRSKVTWNCKPSRRRSSFKYRRNGADLIYSKIQSLFDNLFGLITLHGWPYTVAFENRKRIEMIFLPEPIFSVEQKWTHCYPKAEIY